MLFFSMIHAIARAEETHLSERNLEAPFCYVRGGTRSWPIVEHPLPAGSSMTFAARNDGGILARGEMLDFDGSTVIWRSDDRLEIESKPDGAPPAFELKVSLNLPGGTTETQRLNVRFAPLVAWASSTGDTIELVREDLMRLMGLFAQFPIRDICVDRADPQRWYGLMESGVAVTEDAGKSWRLSTEGLHIPQVHALCTPRNATDVYVGTPAGLYVSRDHGKTWQDTTLVPQYEGAEREEIGGAGYLISYWMGRYHGFIDEQTATAEWWE